MTINILFIYLFNKTNIKNFYLFIWLQFYTDDKLPRMFFFLKIWPPKQPLHQLDTMLMYATNMETMITNSSIKCQGKDVTLDR